MIFSLILWSPFKDNFDDPIEDLRNAGLRIIRKNIFCFTDLNFENAVKKVCEFHNVDKDDIEEYFDREIIEQLGE